MSTQLYCLQSHCTPQPEENIGQYSQRQCLASHIKQNHQISELCSTLATVCPNPHDLQTSREELVFQGGLELDLGPSSSTQKQVDLLHALSLKCNTDAKHLDLGQACQTERLVLHPTLDTGHRPQVPEGRPHTSTHNNYKYGGSHPLYRPGNVLEPMTLRTLLFINFAMILKQCAVRRNCSPDLDLSGARPV